MRTSSALGTDDEAIMVFKDDTLRADDQAFFLKVRDAVQAAVSEAIDERGGQFGLPSRPILLSLIATSFRTFAKEKQHGQPSGTWR